MKHLYSLGLVLALGTLAAPLSASKPSLYTYEQLCDSSGLLLQPNHCGRIRLRQNVTIDGTCRLFEQSNHRCLKIAEGCQFEVRVTSGSTLDLSGGTLVIGGEIIFVLEPGAEIFFGTEGNEGTLVLKDNAKAGLATGQEKLDLCQFNC